MSVAIPDEFLPFVAREISSGKFRSETDVVTEALRLLQERERKLDALRAEIQIGLEELDRGERAELDLEDTKARGRQRLAERATRP